MAAVTKPTAEQLGWNVNVDALFDDHNANPLTNGATDLTGAAVGDLLTVATVNGSNVATAVVRKTPPMSPVAAAIIFGG